MVSGMETTNNNSNSNLNTNLNSVPSPQSVGREFVRQYYTVLNQGPHFLHRFYSDDSSFVHGGVDRPGEVSNPVYGQDNINKKILSMNFKDCHAKIRQVDSMETIGKGVVIQVTGELSNNGQPMRRFLQTFVLAPQSPTKYYVRNDVFRYQDEIFLDDDDYSEVEKTDVELEKTEVPDLTAIDEKEDTITSVGTEFYENTNGTAHENLISGTDKIPLNNEVSEERTTETNSSDVFEEETFPKNEEFVDRRSTSPQPQPNEQKTYANMVSKNPNANFPPFAAMSTFTTANKPNESQTSLSTPFARPTETSPIPSMATNSGTSFIQQSSGSVSGKPPSNTNNVQNQRENRAVRRNQQYNRRNESREMTPGRGGLNDSDSADGDYQSKKQFPDENQVFVGNLPQNIVDDDLRNLFARYGRILDVRINRQNQKMGSNVKTPNYGFVTFENPDIVQQILKQKPIYFDNHRFNVEEKRSQGGRGSQNFDRNSNRGSSGGAQGGGGGGMGGRLNNSMGNISGNRSQSGGSSGNQRNRGNQPFSSGGGSRGGGSGGFGPNRNSSFSGRQNR